MEKKLSFEEWLILVSHRFARLEWSINIDRSILEEYYEKGSTPEETVQELEPDIEPEDCEYCAEEDEESDIEYEKNVTWDGSIWICDNCRRPI